MHRLAAMLLKTTVSQASRQNLKITNSKLDWKTAAFPKGSLKGTQMAKPNTIGSQQEHIPVDWEGVLRMSDEEPVNELFGPCVTNLCVTMHYMSTPAVSSPHKLLLTVNNCGFSSFGLHARSVLDLVHLPLVYTHAHGHH